VVEIEYLSHLDLFLIAKHIMKTFLSKKY